jgi:hypothetical protein
MGSAVEQMIRLLEEQAFPFTPREIEEAIRRCKQLKNSPQIRTLFLFRSRFIQERKTSRRAAKGAKGG